MNVVQTFGIFLNIVHDSGERHVQDVGSTRGAAASAAEDFADRNALVILDQQIRDAAAAVERGRRALALAMAHDDSEAARLQAMLVRIADLEDRAVSVLEGGRERGRRRAAESVRALKRRGAGTGDASLEDAEATLRRLRERHSEADAVEASLARFDTAAAGGTVADRLEAACFGPTTRPTPPASPSA